MIVRVKYCGGCNASYDRAALVKRIQEMFPSIPFAHADAPGSSPDFALAVCGCSVRCADYKNFQGSLGRFVIASQNDFFLACQEIERASR